MRYYTFIGTEQDLINNGFKPYYENGKLCSFYRGNDEHMVIVSINQTYFEKGEIFMNWNDEDAEEYIQDLIEKGLVKEVEE